MCVLPGFSEQIWPSCCPSFFVCLSYGCIFSCFYQTPSLLLCVRPCRCFSLSINVCLSFYVFFSLLSFLPFLLFFFLSLSLTLSPPWVKTPQEHKPVKFLSVLLLHSVPSSPPPGQIGFSLFLSLFFWLFSTILAVSYFVLIFKSTKKHPNITIVSSVHMILHALIKCRLVFLELFH